MALQSTTNTAIAVGIPGQEVTHGQSVYLPYQVISDGTVKPGAFAFAGTSTDTTGEEFAYATFTLSASDTPLGFVERVVDQAIASALSDAQEVYPAGTAATIAIRGQYYIKAPNSCTAGQKVCVEFTTGDIVVADSASDGEVDTGWTVRIPNGGASASEGDLIIIERY